MTNNKNMIDISEFNIYGISLNNEGAPLPIFCIKCKQKLTTIFLNNKCTIDIDVECSNCGFKATGRNLYAELQGKVKVPK